MIAKPYHANPRHMTAKQDKLLTAHLRELGDLGGIVHDLNSGEIIGGNQRVRIMADGKATIDKTYDTPTPTGTVAEGYVLWQGERYAYRQVRWTPEQCAKACIVANHDGGSWDMDRLANFDLDDLKDWGFEDGELGLETEADGGGAGTGEGSGTEEVECPKCGQKFTP